MARNPEGGGNSSRITIESSIIKNNKGKEVGGVHIRDFSHLFVKDTIFFNNTSDETSTIQVYNAHLSVKESKFLSNKGGREGDIIWIGYEIEY